MSSGTEIQLAGSVPFYEPDKTQLLVGNPHILDFGNACNAGEFTPQGGKGTTIGQDVLSVVTLKNTSL